MVLLGALFPQTEFGTDAAAVRDFAQAVEGMGFSHCMTYDHVVGANVERPDRKGGRWPYTHESQFHEPFVLFSYMAAVTRALEFVTGIVILPQRQTVLAAKQAASLDILSEGRLRLGVGLGWNQVEYEALGEQFSNRGRRVEEQIALMRALWTQELVTFEGRWHHVTDAGINPLPVQRPIPVWMGGWADSVLRRVARIGDGWVLAGRPTPEIVDSVARLRSYAAEAGRNPGEIGLQGSILLRTGDPDEWRGDLQIWNELGATHVVINSSGCGHTSPAQHVAALEKAKALLDS